MNKKFRFKFSPIVYVLIFIVTAICIIGAGGSAYNLFSSTSQLDLKKTVQIITLILDLFILMFALSIVFFGYYKITDKKLIARFGFIYSSYEYKNVKSIATYKKIDKLVLYYSKSYMVIVIDKNDNDEFIKTLREVMPNIPYEIISEE